MKKILYSIFCLLLLLKITGCEKDTEPTLFPPVTVTGEAESITRFEAKLTGTVTSDPESEAGQTHDVYFLYSHLSPNLLDHPDTIPATAGEKNWYTALLKDLKAGERYYYCIVASSAHTSVKGEITSFTTLSTEEPTVSIQPIGNSESSISLKGEVTEDGGAAIIKRGFVYRIDTGDDSELTTDNGTNVEGTPGEGMDFYAIISGEIKPATAYIIRAYAVNKEQKRGYSDTIRVVTDEKKVPVLITGEPVNLTAYTAQLHATIVTDNNSKVIKRGICYSSETSNPTISNPYKLSESTENEFDVTLTDLEPGKTYYYCAYAENSKGPGYGEVRTFTLPQPQTLMLSAPNVSNITIETADVTSTITIPEGSSILQKGVCYSSNVLEPTTSENCVIDPTTDNQITLKLEGLTEGTRYYIRAFAVSRDATYYSTSSTEFTTVQTTRPEVGNVKVSGITLNAAAFSAKILADGGAAVSAKGFCYSKINQNPTLEDLTVADLSDGTEINAQTDHLEEGTTYYVRAYATNKNGTTYSNTASFKTIEYFKPTVSELISVTVNDDNATMQAVILDKGGLEIKECGFCWSSTSSEPDISHDKKVTSTPGQTTFQGVLTELAYNTSYYVRAYATNEKGTGYSGFITIRTGSSEKPTMGTLTTENVTQTSIDVTAKIIDDGGSSIEEKGFCYSTSGNPTVEDNPTPVTESGNTLSKTLTGLQSYTKYYIRAYAWNKNGITYSNMVTVTTKKTNPDIDDPVSPGSK